MWASRPWPETVLVLQGCVGAWYDLWVGRELNAVMTDSENDDQTNIRPSQYVGGDATGVSGSLDQDALNALPIGTKLREFEVTSLIGVGGFGIVYLAHDHSLGRYVALKEYMPSSLAYRPDGKAVSVRSTRDADTFAAGLRSFINEARLLAQFDHPSLVKVHHFWEESGTAFMVMPFYEGQTLKQALRDITAPPSEEWLMALLLPLTDALQTIHMENCFHRDIAPDNILLLNNGQPVLLDFGAARRVISGMSQNLTVILKPGYAPVEQYAEVSNLGQGAWTDIYALAAVIHYAITGKAPAPSVGRMMNDTLVPLEQAAKGRYSDSFLRGIDRALSVRQEHRPQNIAEFRSLLGLGDNIPPRLSKRMPVARVLGGLTAVILAVGSGAYFLMGRPVPPPGVAAAPVPQVELTKPDQKDQVERERQAELRGQEEQAVQAQAATDTLLKRIESSQREIESSMREAKSQVERAEAGVRSARSDSENWEVAQRLREAHRQLAVAEELRTLTGALVFKTEVIVEVKGQMNQGAIALKEGRMSAATGHLLGAQKSAEALLVLSEAIKGALGAKMRADAAMADLKIVGDQERKKFDASDAQAYIERGNALVRNGKFRPAQTELAQGQAIAEKALNVVLDDLIPRYAALADRASAADDFETAGVALSRAKALTAMKR